MRGPAIGALRQRVTLEAASRVDDGAGSAIVTWSPVAQMWAAIDPVTGSELAEADTEVGRAMHDITIRVAVGVTPGRRFVHAGRIFDIRAIAEDGRGRWLVCRCEEHLP